MPLTAFVLLMDAAETLGGVGASCQVAVWQPFCRSPQDCVRGLTCTMHRTLQGRRPPSDE